MATGTSGVGIIEDGPFSFSLVDDPTFLGRNIMGILMDDSNDSRNHFVVVEKVPDVDWMQEGQYNILTRMKFKLVSEWEQKNEQPFPWHNYGGRPLVDLPEEEKSNFDKI